MYLHILQRMMKVIKIVLDNLKLEKRALSLLVWV